MRLRSPLLWCALTAMWLLLNGTFERAAGWYRALWREMQGPNEYAGHSLSLPSYANRRFYPKGMDDPGFQAEMRRVQNDPIKLARFQERFLGIPNVPHDMVFWEFVRNRHISPAAEYTPGFPVILAVDPGYDPSPAVVLFCQRIENQIRVFDEIYVTRVLRSAVINQVLQHWAFSHITDVVLDPYGDKRDGVK